MYTYRVKYLQLSTEHSLVVSIQGHELVLSFATINEDPYSDLHGVQVEHTEVEELRLPVSVIKDLSDLLVELEAEDGFCAAISHG